MREIPLTKGYVALVDDADYAALVEFKWYAYADPKRTTVYAVRNSKTDENGNRVTIRMHRQIAGLDSPDVDHWDGNGLNNQRHNLRACGTAPNTRNTKTRRSSSTQRKGVTANGKKYLARIEFEGDRLRLGLFPDVDSAARAYDSAARKHFGEFARVNFPLQGEMAA